jgi:hypothetical protein
MSLFDNDLRFSRQLAPEVPQVGVPSTVPGAPSSDTILDMKKRPPAQSDEPVGIVISRGREPEPTPRFVAYVWAPSPEDELEEKTQRA